MVNMCYHDVSSIIVKVANCPAGRPTVTSQMYVIELPNVQVFFSFVADRKE